ncbi:MAG: hypothetical protein H6867_03045 [Rhodospirillales bacterium]|nr:hypothetical protein [Rhodospirillales bacterium]MCB9996127.1 hypothetical protein [Rhodospirillales bacterium]
MTDPAPHNDQPVWDTQVISIDTVAPDVKIIKLAPVQGFTYKAGQYIDICFGGLERRPYSLAAAPGETPLEIHIKRGKGEVSRYVMDELNPGDPVNFTGPGGNNFYDPQRRDPILALAGGLGVAPVKAITEQALKEKTPHPVTLYWGTVSEDERYLDPYFKKLAQAYGHFNYNPVSGDHVGNRACADITDFSPYQIFVSGPPAMLHHILPLLLDNGADRGKIHYDRHPEAATLPA